MPAINFPDNPVDQETCIRAGKTWIYTAAKNKWSVVVGMTITTAEAVSFTPTGGIAATNVQAAIAELDADLSILKRYSVSKYGASGAGTNQTLGGINAGANALTVSSTASFAVGHGIFIAGAGAAGARLVATITAIVGNIITISIAASTTVIGAVVKHDDTAAINAAIAAAYNAGGGEVYFPNGHYRCAAPLNATTNSVLTFPVIDVYHLTRRSVSLIGENTGYMDSGYTAIASGGVALDFTDAIASGVYPSAISTAPYVEFPTYSNPGANGWNSVDVEIDRLMVVVSPGAMSGVNLHNCFRARIGDSLSVHVKATGAPTNLLTPLLANPTGTGSKGIDFPAVLNNIVLNCGSASVSGFEFGIVAGEHTFFTRPSIIFCQTGLLIPTASHLISGDLSIENCQDCIKHIGAGSVVDLRLQVEHSNTTSWWRARYGWFGNGLGKGRVDHITWNKLVFGENAFYQEAAGEVFFHDILNAFGGTINYGKARRLIIGPGDNIASSNPSNLWLGGYYGSNPAGHTGNSKVVLYFDQNNGHCGIGITNAGVENYCFNGGAFSWFTPESGNAIVQNRKMVLSTVGVLRPKRGLHCEPYANDAAADTDANLLSGEFYYIIGNRNVFRKP